MKESVIERYLREEVIKREGLCIKLTPPPKGIPDRLVVLPYKFLAFVELKKPDGGVISALQRYFSRKLGLLHQLHYIITTKAEVDDLMHKWEEYMQRKRRAQ